MEFFDTIFWQSALANFLGSLAAGIVIATTVVWGVDRLANGRWRVKLRLEGQLLTDRASGATIYNVSLVNSGSVGFGSAPIYWRMFVPVRLPLTMLSGGMTDTRITLDGVEYQNFGGDVEQVYPGRANVIARFKLEDGAVVDGAEILYFLSTPRGLFPKGINVDLRKKPRPLDVGKLGRLKSMGSGGGTGMEVSSAQNGQIHL